MLRLSMLFILFSVSSRAMVFQAMDLPHEQFQTLVQSRNQTTYSDYMLGRFKNERKAPHARTEAFAQRLLESPKGVQAGSANEWETLRKSVDLNRADREILFLLAQKTNNAPEMCRLALLETSLEITDQQRSLCRSRAVNLPKGFKNILRPRDLLVANNIPFRVADIPDRVVAGVYEWKIISDDFKDFTFRGTAEEFARQKIKRDPWVSGKKDEFKFNGEETGLASRAAVAFSGGQVLPVVRPQRSWGQWAEDHKTALYVVGIALAGFGAYQMRDKNLILTWP